MRKNSNDGSVGTPVGAGGDGSATPPPAPPPPPRVPTEAFAYLGSYYPPPSSPSTFLVGAEQSAQHATNTNDAWAYGPAPPEPLFPWQFFADKNAAKLSQVRQRRLETAAKRREEALAKRNERNGAASSGPAIPEPVLKASVPPEDGTCFFDMIPREILLYILQDVGEETLATACPFVNHVFYEASLDDQLWRHLFLVDIGRAPPPLRPPHKYRQPATEKEEYFYKIWKWYESYGGLARDVREERFTERTKGWMEVSPFANSRMALLSEITTFDQRKLRRVFTPNDRSAPALGFYMSENPRAPTPQQPNSSSSSNSSFFGALVSALHKRRR